ncbi:isochorismate synthase MenF [Tepidibacillus sp. HK-1]|uniref:isochorismate synthase n=1 Tax=Tepidibacillus sp. HK-1 TaxID=1883407 RepID=UPI0008534FFD|nr:isochorismate synthase [Tepidibacillus sp. HK-1]GBF12260.1 salicylate biosynthesis isochorismate synthase [Tepidibacillus sp. HK-1]
MITINQDRYSKWIFDGIKHATRKEQPLILSFVQKIKSLDPLQFFKNASALFFGQRMFWSDSAGEMSIVGVGHTYVIEAEKTRPFQSVKEKWATLLEQVLLNNDSENKGIGTGPLLLGGFSFDPYKSKSSLWQEFKEGILFLPTFMLTQIKGESWLTINLQVTKEGHPEFLAKKLGNELNILLQENENLNNEGDQVTQPMIQEVDPETWLNSVRKVTKHIQQGDLEKVVLARELQLQTTKPIFAEHVLIRLREQQPDSYLFAIENGEKCFLGASPERLVKKAGDKLLTTCLAGTICRGKTIEQDVELGQQLLHDRKNRYEHDLVVQMIRSVMEEGCSKVVTPSEPILYKLKDVQHLYTPIVGYSDSTSILDMVERLHPTPALGGYPRSQAMELIRKEEILDRGWYGAPIGWFDREGNGEFAVAIRSGMIHGRFASLFAGCGIVQDSIAESEYEETMIKFRPMLKAIGGKINEQ